MKGARGHNARISLALFACTVILLSVEFLPPLPVYLQLNSSLAVGTISASCIAIILAIVSKSLTGEFPSTRSVLDFDASQIVFATALLLCIVVHGIVASILFPVDFRRFSLSLIPVVLLLGGSFGISRILRRATTFEIHTATWICFWIFIAIILLRLLRAEPSASIFRKAMFPFTETSHFALAFGAVYLYRCTSAPRRNQLMWILFGFLLTIVLKSATFAVFAFCAAILCRRLLITTLSGFFALSAGAATHLSYFTSRADISSHSSNVSALVYAQGWAFLVHSLAISRGWGIGFQQLGTQRYGLAVSNVIRAANDGVWLNTKDGGFLLSKLGSEFGIFGIVIAVAYIVVCLNSILRIRRSKRINHETFARCVIIAFGVDLFIRGMGYFYGSTLLFLGCLFSVFPVYKILRHGSNSRSGGGVVLR